MFLLNARLAAVILLVVPLIAVLTAVFQKKMLVWNRKVRETNSEITGAYNEGITGVETSKTMVIEDLNHKSFQEITDKMKRSSMTLAKLTAIYMPLILFFSSTVTAFVLARGGYFVQEQVIALGTLSVFLSYAVGIFEPIQHTKTVYLEGHNPRLHTDEVLVALSVLSNRDERCRRALEMLPRLRGCQMHSTVMLGEVDRKIFKKLGVGLTCDPSRKK